MQRLLLEMGIETEYMRIDRPAPSRRPHSFKGLCDPVCGFPVHFSLLISFILMLVTGFIA